MHVSPDTASPSCTPHNEVDRLCLRSFFYFTSVISFSHLADAFIQSDLQIRKSN